MFLKTKWYLADWFNSTKKLNVNLCVTGATQYYLSPENGSPVPVLSQPTRKITEMTKSQEFGAETSYLDIIGRSER